MTLQRKRRWKVGIKQRMAVQDYVEVKPTHQRKYLQEASPDPAQRLMRLGNAVHLVRQIGNFIETSFPSFRKRSLLHAIRGGRNRLCYAERESGTPIRYVRETRRWGNIVERLLEKGLEPLVQKLAAETKSKLQEVAQALVQHNTRYLVARAKAETLQLLGDYEGATLLVEPYL